MKLNKVHLDQKPESDSFNCDAHEGCREWHCKTNFDTLYRNYGYRWTNAAPTLGTRYIYSIYMYTSIPTYWFYIWKDMCLFTAVADHSLHTKNSQILLFHECSIVKCPPSAFDQKNCPLPLSSPFNILDLWSFRLQIKLLITFLSTSANLLEALNAHLCPSLLWHIYEGRKNICPRLYLCVCVSVCTCVSIILGY